MKLRTKCQAVIKFMSRESAGCLSDSTPGYMSKQAEYMSDSMSEDMQHEDDTCMTGFRLDEGVRAFVSPPKLKYYARTHAR